MPKLIRDENLAFGLPPSQQSRFLQGISDLDSGTTIEQNFQLPWTVNPPTSYLFYLIWIEVLLDSGIVVHRALPQSNPAIDTLATVFLGDPNAADSIKEINTVSVGTFTDTAQRMAHSIYRFALKGHGLRAGYTIPIPGMKTVCGVPAIPEERQWAYSKIVGNWSGIPIWLAEWDLRYTVTLPPKAQQVTGQNLALHINGNQPLPKENGVQVPWSPPDSNAQSVKSGH